MNDFTASLKQLVKEAVKEALSETLQDFELSRPPAQVAHKEPPKPVEAKRLAVKINDAAEMLSLSPSTVRRLISNGSLKASHKTRHILIPITELERLMKV